MYASNAVFPPISVFPVALTLVDQRLELGTTVFMLELLGRITSRDMISVGQKQPDQPNGKW